MRCRAAKRLLGVGTVTSKTYHFLIACCVYGFSPPLGEVIAPTEICQKWTSPAAPEKKKRADHGDFPAFLTVFAAIYQKWLWPAAERRQERRF